MFKRDERDPRLRERLAGSTFISLALHVLFAALLFSVALSTAQEGASESVVGASIVTLEQRAPVVARAAPSAVPAAPVPVAPKIAPKVQHPPVVRAAARPIPPRRHELSVLKPSASPNPTPVPQASPKPNPQPTTPVIEPNPSTEIAAVPTAVPTIAPQSIAVKLPPTAAPSPVPTARPTAAPTPKPAEPTAAPTAAPATPSPVQSMVPTASPKPAGTPSPSPTQAPVIAKLTAGRAPTPGPAGTSSPGPRAAAAAGKKPGPQRPVTVAPTPSPAPTPHPLHTPARGSSGFDINAKLRALLPHNAVVPTEVSAPQHISLAGQLEPTPPPTVLAATKYLYRGSGGGDALKMWVTSTRRVGPLLFCDGWMLRYPPNVEPSHNVTLFGAQRSGRLPPIVEARASVPCSARALEPFAPSAAASP